MKTRKHTAAGGEPGDGQFNAAAQEAIERFARVMLSCGVAPRLLTDAVRDALGARPDPAASRDLGLREIPEAAHLVTLWCTSSDYVDEAGAPRPLPVRGRRRSLEALARKLSPSVDVDEIVRYLMKTQTLRKVGRTYGLTRRWVYVHGLEGYAHTRSVRALVGLLRTIEHNLCAPTDADTWFEFAADNLHFPVSQLPALDKRMRREGLGCLRKLDLFMQQCADQRNPAEPSVWVGVDMHRFQQDALARGARRSQSKHTQRTPTKGRRNRRGDTS
jgi:hypothetical protein